MDYYPTISAQETKQTNKQNNLLTLTVSYDKRSCLIRGKKKKIKPKIIVIIIVINKKREKR